MQNEPSETTLSRVPQPDGGIQVNFCKNPQCKQFGTPASPNLQPRGRTAVLRDERDTYRISGTGKLASTLVCSICGKSTTIKSNKAIKEELDRLSAYLDYKPSEPTCPNKNCPNHTVGIRSKEKQYQAFGKSAAGSLRYRCKLCKKTFTVKQTTLLRQRKPSKNIDVFLHLVGNQPFQKMAKVMGISMVTLFRKIDFIYAQCQAFVANRERKLMNGDVQLERAYLSVDRQAYGVNWTNANERKNTIIWAIGSVDNETGYNFGMHLNYDGSLDARKIEREAIAYDDYSKPIFHRRFARLWLQKDYRDAWLKGPGRKDEVDTGALYEAIDTTYRNLEERLDNEVFEFQDSDTKLPNHGMLTHAEYTTYAHFMFLKRLLRHVEKIRFFLDQDTAFSAGCFSAFADEIMERKVDAFYVKILPGATVNVKRNAVGATKRALNALYDKYQLSEYLLRHALVKEKMHELVTIGGNKEKWFIHPIAKMTEPEKAVCYLTNMGDYDEDHLAWLYLKASLHGINSYFNKARSSIRQIDRHGTSHSTLKREYLKNQVYNPERIVKLLEIMRVCHNYIDVGEKDKKTPAMRIGLAKSPVRVEDIIYYNRFTRYHLS